MRLSLAQAAAGTLTTVVAAGLLLLPSRVLGPEQQADKAVALPAITAVPSVQAAPPPAPPPKKQHKSPELHPAPTGVSSLASVVAVPPSDAGRSPADAAATACTDTGANARSEPRTRPSAGAHADRRRPGTDAEPHARRGPHSRRPEGVARYRALRRQRDWE